MAVSDTAMAGKVRMSCFYRIRLATGCKDDGYSAYGIRTYTRNKNVMRH